MDWYVTVSDRLQQGKWDARNGRHIEALVLPTQLPSKSEDSDGDPGISNDCNIKENIESKNTFFSIEQNKDLSSKDIEVDLELNVMA